jgi:hypothetical protein
MRAAINDLRRRADLARRLAKGVTSDDARENLITAAREYDRQAAALEMALGENGKD